MCSAYGGQKLLQFISRMLNVSKTSERSEILRLEYVFVLYELSFHLKKHDLNIQKGHLPKANLRKDRQGGPPTGLALTALLEVQYDR